MIVSVTGHRPDKLDARGINAYPGSFAYERLVAMCMTLWDYMRPEKIVTGMALGFDMAAAQAAINLNIPFVAAVPHLGQESKWPHSSQEYYKKLLEHASEIEYVTQGEYTAKSMQLRNMWMVDHSDIVVALWNGDEKGGTFNCVTYAKKQGKTINNFWGGWIKHKDRLEFNVREESPIDYFGIVFPTLHHYIEAMQYKDERLRRFIASKSLKEIPVYGDKIRDDWTSIANDAILYGIREKYKQNPNLVENLTKSYPRKIYHWSETPDMILDVDIKTGKGKNMIGNLLEVVRGELREQFPT